MRLTFTFDIENSVNFSNGFSTNPETFPKTILSNLNCLLIFRTFAHSHIRYEFVFQMRLTFVTFTSYFNRDCIFGTTFAYWHCWLCLCMALMLFCIAWLPISKTCGLLKLMWVSFANDFKNQLRNALAIRLVTLRSVVVLLFQAANIKWFKPINTYTPFYIHAQHSDFTNKNINFKVQRDFLVFYHFVMISSEGVITQPVRRLDSN